MDNSEMGEMGKAPTSLRSDAIGLSNIFYYKKHWRVSRLGIRVENANGDVFTDRLATTRGMTVHTQSHAIEIDILQTSQ